LRPHLPLKSRSRKCLLPLQQSQSLHQRNGLCSKNWMRLQNRLSLINQHKHRKPLLMICRHQRIGHVRNQR
jgi:hypothetical protein